MARSIRAFLSLCPGELGVAVNSCGKLNEGDGAAITGLPYVAVLIARLVSLYSAAKSDDS